MARKTPRPRRSSKTATPPSYKIVKGYSYDLYRTVWVPGYSYKRGRKRIRVKGYERRVFIKTVVVPPRRVEIAPLVEPPKPERPAPSAAPRPGEWINVGEFMAAVEFWAAQQSGLDGPGLVELDFEIGRKSIVNDFISKDRFVWTSARYPRGVTLKRYKSLGDSIFDRARLWLMISHKETREFRLWVRTVRLRHPFNFDEAKAEVLGRVLNQIAAEFENKTYLIFHGVIAWTLYTVAKGDKPMRRKAEGTQ